MPPPAHGVVPGLEGHAVGDPVQPRAQRAAPGDRPRFAGEHQKGRLKGVLGVVVVADDAAADAEDHRAVTADEGFKGRFVPLLDEGGKQLTVRRPRRILPQHGPAKLPDHRVHPSRCHTSPPWSVAPSPYP